VPKSALPDFGTPAHLMPDDFWSNLKQFLLERPVKIIERRDVPFTRNTFGSGLGENLRFFLSAPKARKGPINKRLEVDWGGNFGGFMGQLKEFFSPTRAVMPAGIKPVQVKEIWSKDENFGWTQAIALAAHAVIIALGEFDLARERLKPSDSRKIRPGDDRIASRFRLLRFLLG